MNKTNFEEKGTKAFSQFSEDVETNSKSLVPVLVSEKKSRPYIEEKLKNYRKGQKEHIIYTRIYLLFFFLGACVFASGKWGCEVLSEKAMKFLLSGTDDFPDFCFNFAPAVFGSFLVYASGFTVYAPLLSVLYSALTFSFFGVSACSLVFLHGVSLKVILSIALIGVLCCGCIAFCTVTNGISKIASRGIGKLGGPDGLLYSLLYWFYILLWYYGMKGLHYFLNI